MKVENWDSGAPRCKQICDENGNIVSEKLWKLSSKLWYKNFGKSVHYSHGYIDFEGHVKANT